MPGKIHNTAPFKEKKILKVSCINPAVLYYWFYTSPTRTSALCDRKMSSWEAVMKSHECVCIALRQYNLSVLV